MVVEEVAVGTEVAVDVVEAVVEDIPAPIPRQWVEGVVGKRHTANVLLFQSCNMPPSSITHAYHCLHSSDVGRQ